MIATKDQLIHGHTGLFSHAAQPSHEILRCHTGIATILIHLIAGRLDHGRQPCLGGIGQDSFQNMFVRGAKTGQPDAFAGAVAGNQIMDEGHAICSFGRAVSRNLAISAGLELPSIGPCRVTAMAPAALA